MAQDHTHIYIYIASFLYLGFLKDSLRIPWGFLRNGPRTDIGTGVPKAERSPISDIGPDIGDQWVETVSPGPSFWTPRASFGDHFEQSGWSGASFCPPLSKSNAWSSPAQASICQPASQRASSQPAPTSQPARIRDFLWFPLIFLDFLCFPMIFFDFLSFGLTTKG